MATTETLPLLALPCTLSDLVRLVDKVPEDEVPGLIPAFARKVEELAQGDDRAAYLRHLIVLGALVNRAISQICDVPKDAEALI